MTRQRGVSQDFLVEIGTEELPPKSLLALADRVRRCIARD